MKNSEALFQRACKVIPGGVNSPVRAFTGVGGTPIFFAQGEGACLVDVDRKSYIDYVGSWGSMICGHAHAEIIHAVTEAVQQGLGFGSPTAVEVELAEKICTVMSMDMLRMTCSGTEATMSAIRLARGYTGRDKIIKFKGCYHGHTDALLVNAGSGALTLGVPSSPGVPESVAQHTLTLEYNNCDQVRQVFKEIGDQIAAVIVEPVAGNMSCIPPVAGFLQTLRETCDDSASLLIFDEVMTGFRVGLTGAQGLYQVKPDLTTLGKIIGGGMPVGAFGGRREIMEQIAPTGPVYQAGTLAGNPVAMVAGLKNLQIIQRDGFYPALNEKTEALVSGILEAAKHHQIALQANRVGAMFGLFFTEQSPVCRFEQLHHCDHARFKQFFHAMLEQGVYLAPSAFESGFVSAAHTRAQIQVTIDAAERVLARL